MTKTGDHRARREHDGLRRIVGDALRRADPIGLMAMGAPSDEYDPELGTILPLFTSVGSQAELEKLIHSQFVAWFGADEAGPSGRYSSAAREVWERWLVLEARRLSGEEDVEVVPVESVEIRYDGRLIPALTVIRTGTRYFVEARDAPGEWWMGEEQSEGCVAVWSSYGPHREAFAAH